jgi:hypothetical protein
MGFALTIRHSSSEQYNRDGSCFAEMMMVHRLKGEMLSKVINRLTDDFIERPKCRTAAYTCCVIPLNAALPGGDQMVSQFNILRAEAGAL